MKLFLSEFAEFTVDLSKIHNLSLNLYINTPQCTIFSERDSRSKTIERALTTLSLNCQKTSSCEFPSNHCQLSCPYLFGSIPPEGSLECRVLDCNNYFFYSGKISCGVVYTQIGFCFNEFFKSSTWSSKPMYSFYYFGLR